MTPTWFRLLGLVVATLAQLAGRPAQLLSGHQGHLLTFKQR